MRNLTLSPLLAFAPPDPSVSPSPVLFLPLPLAGFPIRLWPSAAIFVAGRSVTFELDVGRFTVGVRGAVLAPNDERFACD